MKRTNTTFGEGEGSGALAPEPAAPNAVLLQVHLWVGPKGASASEAADVPPPALAMAADLLQVRGGELRDSPAGSIAATFPDAVVAVNAARNLQRLVQGFSRAWQGGALGGCTTLMRVDEARDGIDAGSLRGNQALKQAHPGQVLLVGGLCEAARSIPGLEFRSIAGVALGPLGKKGTARQALQLLPPLHMEGFVEEPFEPKAVEEAPAAAPAPVPVPPVAESRPPAYVLVSSPPSGKSAAVPAATPSSGSMTAVPLGATRAVPPAPAAADEIGLFSREEKASGNGKSRWVILGGVAAAVIAGILMFTLRRASHPTPSPAQQMAAAASSEPAAAPANSVPASSEAPAPTPVVSTKTKANDAAHGKGAAHATNAPAEQEATEPAPIEDIRPAHGLTFTPAEINSLIAHADKDSGNGNFDKAIQEYRLVLSREPANDLAKRGLARALYNKEHR
jgi:hypothetical protein